MGFSDTTKKTLMNSWLNTKFRRTDMKQINLATTIMCMLAVPVFSKINLIMAYAYIAIFLVAIGWEKKKPFEGGDR